ncbi:GNAT family N-acetyltransferase [Endozoicomonas arenosclerae]|uniref:GNAT family N-acetyltransferase n=1 Tax=Endozoicomonas arenosclerae TaxID=1633495 RepID=UPI000784604E|nr:GNAT family N-acetyltransferase [Endozoicomonas arenosclerae]
MTPEELQPVAFPLANRFFKENGHKGKARSNERVFILRDGKPIVAALRATPKADGYLLRSVWVQIGRRSEGLGSQLVKTTLEQLSPSPCWCYPYNHLEAFYAHLGFQKTSPDEAPSEISGPYLSYLNKGESFLLMAYQAY